VVRRGSAKAALDFAVVVQVTEGVGGGDGGGDEWPAFGALAQFFHTDPVGIGFDRLKIGDHFVPVEHQMVRPHALAEVDFGRRDGGLKRKGQQEQDWEQVFTRV
jgi:hypothetical protein